jgi:hypothetical protein
MKARGFFTLSCVALLVVTLVGCAGVQRQAFNKDVNQDIRTIGLLEQIEQEKYVIDNIGHPGTSFGLIGGIIAVADITSKRNTFTDLMKEREFNVVEEFQEMLATELEKTGYSVKRIKPERKKHALLEKYEGLDEDVDVYLDFTLGAGYICASSSADYIPTIHSVVRLVKRGSNEILYQEVIYYGYKFLAKEAACLNADRQYYFNNFEAIKGSPDRAMEGIREGVPLISRHIAESVAR